MHNRAHEFWWYRGHFLWCNTFDSQLTSYSPHVLFVLFKSDRYYLILSINIAQLFLLYGEYIYLCIYGSRLPGPTSYLPIDSSKLLQYICLFDWRYIQATGFVFVYLSVSWTLSKFEDQRCLRFLLQLVYLYRRWCMYGCVQQSKRVRVFIFESIFSSSTFCFHTRWEWQPKAASSLWRGFPWQTPVLLKIRHSSSFYFFF